MTAKRAFHCRRHHSVQCAGAVSRAAERRARIATGFVANMLCSETFVSGSQPDQICPRQSPRCRASA